MRELAGPEERRGGSEHVPSAKSRWKETASAAPLDVFCGEQLKLHPEAKRQLVQLPWKAVIWASLLMPQILSVPATAFKGSSTYSTLQHSTYKVIEA